MHDGGYETPTYIHVLWNTVDGPRLCKWIDLTILCITPGPVPSKIVFRNLLNIWLKQTVFRFVLQIHVLMNDYDHATTSSLAGTPNQIHWSLWYWVLQEAPRFEFKQSTRFQIFLEHLGLVEPPVGVHNQNVPRIEHHLRSWLVELNIFVFQQNFLSESTSI